MKSLLLGNAHTLSLVYPDETRAVLAATAGLAAEPVEPETLATAAPFEDVEVIFSTWTMPALPEEEIARLFPNLRAVFYAAGSVQYFARPFFARGARVFSGWGANGVPVAEYATAQILLANKGFFPRARLFSRGGRAALSAVPVEFPGNYDCKVGLLGAGMIGRLVIEELAPRHMDVLVFDPFLSDADAAALGVQKASLDEIFSSCQTISNHLADNAQTKNMLTYAHFEKMLPGATFINTGRGAQVVEEDLCRLLRERPDVTAVLDVTCPEPPEEGHPFYTLENVVLTPHIAGSIGREVRRLSAYMADEYAHFAAGEPCRYEVTPAMLATMA